MQAIVGSPRPRDTLAFHILKFLLSHEVYFPILFVNEVSRDVGPTLNVKTGIRELLIQLSHYSSVSSVDIVFYTLATELERWALMGDDGAWFQCLYVLSPVYPICSDILKTRILTTFSDVITKIIRRNKISLFVIFLGGLLEKPSRHVKSLDFAVKVLEAVLSLKSSSTNGDNKRLSLHDFLLENKYALAFRHVFEKRMLALASDLAERRSFQRLPPLPPLAEDIMMVDISGGASGDDGFNNVLPGPGGGDETALAKNDASIKFIIGFFHRLAHEAVSTTCVSSSASSVTVSTHQHHGISDCSFSILALLCTSNHIREALFCYTLFLERDLDKVVVIDTLQLALKFSKRVLPNGELWELFYQNYCTILTRHIPSLIKLVVADGKPVVSDKCISLFGECLSSFDGDNPGSTSSVTRKGSNVLDMSALAYYAFVHGLFVHLLRSASTADPGFITLLRSGKLDGKASVGLLRKIFDHDNTLEEKLNFI